MTTNLSGSLSEFSLAEVLSLLGMGGRTARMQVTSPSAVGAVHLVDGRISSATADSSAAGLLRAVVAALPVPIDDLDHALRSEDPVRSLVDSGVVDRDAAQDVTAEHCTEAISQMLEWREGEFSVWVGIADPADVGVRLEVSALVSTARERAQQWSDLRAALPEASTVLALVADLPQAPVVDVDDWSVLARVDGRRTLAEVLASTGTSPLAVGHRLAQLMTRGLVTVQVGLGDVERERANQLLDAFESAAPDGQVVAVAADPEELQEVHDLFAPAPEELQEVHDLFAAAPEELQEVHDLFAVAPVELHEVHDLFGVAPEELQEVHDLFTTEPGAVEEWQVAGSEPWVVAGQDPVVPDQEPADSFPVSVVPMAHAFEQVPEEGDLGGDGAVWLAAPEAPSLVLEPMVHDLPPVAVEVEPAAEPVVEPFSWSPWAQEMGLGAPPVVAAKPASFDAHGYADMVEDMAGHAHTAAPPVPLAPEAGVVEGHGTRTGFGDVSEVAQYVPQPRDAGDSAVDAGAHVAAAGAHAAAPEPAWATPEGTAYDSQPTPDAPQAEAAPDPLAGGLLAHLMSSVRGL